LPEIGLLFRQLWLLKFDSYIQVGFKQEVIIPFIVIFFKRKWGMGIDRPILTMDLRFEINPVFEK
jgi:hypothetical protein